MYQFFSRHHIMDPVMLYKKLVAIKPFFEVIPEARVVRTRRTAKLVHDGGGVWRERACHGGTTEFKSQRPRLIFYESSGRIEDGDWGSE